MAVYKFRVTFEEHDEVHRDIEIKSVQNFEQFHYAIQESIGFDASKPASFYMSNDNWKKGQEIVYSFPEGNNDSSKILMKNARLCDFIADPHQKIYYVFDQPSQWTFYVELIKILPDGDGVKKYPACVKVHNEAPKQYLKIEITNGAGDSELIDDEIFTEVLVDDEEGEVEDADAIKEDDGNSFDDGVDEEEFDNIEETSEDDVERE